VSARLGWWCYETTTPITEGTYDAARAAVNVALSAAAAVRDGDAAAYGLCRPPGHHAATTLYGGYCFFNNAAIAADHLASTTGSRVAVLDVDYHHGNGTQQIFYERDDVAFVSLHGDPRRAYPYHTGFAAETGAGRGSGSTTNIPLAAGTDDETYLGALDRALDAVDDFDPAIVVVSLGLDTFGGDPICDLALTTEGFHRCGAAVAALGRPLVVLQEGGYAGDALGANAVAWLTGARS
jgi:acetoin utilization deacetylase AcuC-like enzyme